MNALLALSLVAVFGVFLQGANSKVIGSKDASNQTIAADPALTLDEQVQYLRKNLTALWNVVRLLQAQINIRTHDSNAHSITDADHLDAEKTSPGRVGSVHVHMHNGHKHLREIINRNSTNVDANDEDVAHSHNKHHRHRDHYHFYIKHHKPTDSVSVEDVDYKDTVGINHHQPTDSVSVEDVDYKDTVGINHHQPTDSVSVENVDYKDTVGIVDQATN